MATAKGQSGYEIEKINQKINALKENKDKSLEFLNNVIFMLAQNGIEYNPAPLNREIKDKNTSNTRITPK